MADILIVADNQQLRDLLSLVFVDGYNGVLVAKDANEGLELFHRARPKLLLIDLRDGTELLRHVREEDPNAAVIIPTSGTRTTTGPSTSESWSLDTGELLRSVERVLGPRSRTATALRSTRREGRSKPEDPSPGVLLPYFEGKAKDNEQFARGAAIIRRWQAMVSARVDRTEFDRRVRLLESEQAPGTGWFDLWCRVVRWGVEQGLTEERPNPWMS